jgi:hypothetical protein
MATKKDPTPAQVFGQLKKLISTLLNDKIHLLQIVEADLVTMRQRLEVLEQHGKLTTARKRK